MGDDARQERREARRRWWPRVGLVLTLSGAVGAWYKLTLEQRKQDLDHEEALARLKLDEHKANLDQQLALAKLKLDALSTVLAPGGEKSPVSEERIKLASNLVDSLVPTESGLLRRELEASAKENQKLKSRINALNVELKGLRARAEAAESRAVLASLVSSSRLLPATSSTLGSRYMQTTMEAVLFRKPQTEATCRPGTTHYATSIARLFKAAGKDFTNPILDQMCENALPGARLAGKVVEKQGRMSWSASDSSVFPDCTCERADESVRRLPNTSKLKPSSSQAQ